jgi:D-sedoheptulose 7-phosphate isomerase
MKIEDIIQHLKNISTKQVKTLKQLICNSKQVIVIGNGGSNSIASHIAQDYTKFLKIKSFAFSDPSRLTCYINDYGMDQAYCQFLKEFGDKDTFVILISSSGNSQNIINCLEYCSANKIKYALLTGFDNDNLCRKRFKENAALEYWVDSKNYGVVECTHQIFLHSVI